MSPTVLNNDILLSIMSIAPPKVAVSMMGTCRLLYHEGAKIVLQSPVNLDGSEKEALALLRFVQAENLSRCPYVRTLHIVMDTVPKSVAQILAKVVPRLTGLNRLALAGDEIFEALPRLLPLFAALRSIKTLLVLDAGSRCCELVRTLQSTLVSATIHFERMQAATLSLTSATHPVLMLERSAATLETLSCGFLANTNPELTFFPPPRQITYPKLRSLALANSIYPDPIPFIRAAPNLTDLVLENPIVISGGHLRMTELQRAINLELQGGSSPSAPFPLPGLDFGGGGGSAAPCRWEHLQTFRGRVVDLWMLGLASRIPELFLTDVPAERPPTALTEALEHARPTLLQISFRGQPLTDVLGPNSDSDLKAALGSQGAAGVKRLMVQFDVMPQDSGLDVGRALDDLAGVISGLDLCHLQFGVHDRSPSTTDASASTSPSAAHQHDPSSSSTEPERVCSCSAPVSVDRASLSVAERTLDGLDVHEYATRLMGSLPSLNDAVVQIDRPNRSGGSARFAFRGIGREAIMCTGGEIVYREVAKAQHEHTQDED